MKNKIKSYLIELLAWAPTYFLMYGGIFLPVFFLVWSGLEITTLSLFLIILGWCLVSPYLLNRSRSIRSTEASKVQIRQTQDISGSQNHFQTQNLKNINDDLSRVIENISKFERN
jgi:hypothetical protein